MDIAVRRSGPFVPARQALLLTAAAISLIGAAAVDVREAAHPTHLLGLGLVAAVVWGVHAAFIRSLPSRLSAVGVALVAQPLLHLWAEAFESAAPGGGFVHVMATDGRATALQMVSSVLAVLIAGAGVHITRILDNVLGLPLDLDPVLPVADRVVAIPLRLAISGLRSCCWALRTARRGPPVLIES